MKYLDIYRLVGCVETDAPIYFVTNLQYVRLLAEYAKDKEISAKANAVYQQMIASMKPFTRARYSASPTYGGDASMRRTFLTRSKRYMTTPWHFCKQALS